MENQMLELALKQLLSEQEKMKEQIKDLQVQVSFLKTPKKDAELTHHTTKQDDELITIQEVRKILKMSRNSINQMIEKGLLNPVRLTKRSIRYLKSEIQNLININSHEI